MIDPRTPLAAVFAFAPLAAAQSPVPPTGIYCSCPPTRATGVGSVLPDIAALDFVEGVLVRVAWADLEPTPGLRNWAMIDNQITAAQNAGKRVSLAVVSGPLAPGWLETQGAAIFEYDFRGSPERMPVPWDTVHLQRWTELISDLGARYNASPTISLVYATNSSANGFEMQLPMTPVDRANWQAAGYTDGLYTESWNEVVDAFVTAFPDHPVSHEVHPVLGSDAVAQAVAAHAAANYADRVGVLAAWWMVHNAMDVYPGMFDILLEAAATRHGQVQIANSFTMSPERFGKDGIAAELDLAIDSGVRYIEVWNSDLLNAQLQPLFSEANDRLNNPGCSTADLAEPFSTLNFFDLAAYLALYNTGDAAADLALPMGTLNFFDLAAYLTSYNAGCP